MSEPTRWGKGLSFAEAEGLASRWLDGDVIGHTERWRRFRDMIFDYIDKHDMKTRYHTLGQIRQHMVDAGIVSMEAEIDNNLLEHTICEYECVQKCKHLTGPDADECYWPCMNECSPVQASEGFAHDPSDPLKPPPSDIDPEKIGLTTYSFTPAGLLVPKK